MKKKNCLVALWHKYPFWQIPLEYINYLSYYYPHINFMVARSSTELIEKISEAEILYCWEIKETHLEHAKNLSWIQLASSGVDKRIPPNFFKKYNISLTNMKGVGATAIAEFVLGVIISFNRGLYKATLDSAVRKWDRASFLQDSIYAKSLSETTIGILGFGAIGFKIYSLLMPLGVKIKICSRSKPSINGFDNFYSLSQMSAFLDSLDYLIISLPLNDETHHLIEFPEIQLMSPNTFIINVAREEIINREALLKGIFENKIRGILIDVLAQEPPLENAFYPLHDNIIITPHIASLSKSFWEDSINIFCKNIDLFLQKLVKINETFSF